MTELSEELADFIRENVIGGNSPSIESIQKNELAGPKAREGPVNLRNRSVSFFNARVIQACITKLALASMSKVARRPLSKACRPAAAIIAALSVQ